MQERIFKTSDNSLLLTGINMPGPFSAKGAVQKGVKMFYFSEETIVILIVSFV